MSATATAVAPTIIDWTTGAGRRLLSSFSQACNLALRRYYQSAFRGSVKSKLVVRTKVHATAATGNATNQQWRGGGGGRGISGTTKGEATLPAYYSSGGQRRVTSMVSFAAAPFADMTSPLQAAILRELKVDLADTSKAVAPKQEAHCFSSMTVLNDAVDDAEADTDVKAQRQNRREMKSKKLRAQPLWRFSQVRGEAQQSKVGGQTASLSTRAAARKPTVERKARTTKRRMQRSLLAYVNVGK